MKINQNWQSNLDRKNKLEFRPQQVQVKSFDELVKQSNMKLQNMEITALIKELEMQGQRLAKNRSIRELSRFKRLVKKLIDQSVKRGSELTYSSSWTIEGYENVLQVIEKIDEELLHLTDSLLDENQTQLDLLRYIGEIKGLVVNLYT